MSPRLLNDILLIILSVFTFVFLKKTINSITVASASSIEYSLLNILPELSFGSSEENTIIEWDQSKPLKFQDLKGHPDDNSNLKSEGVVSFVYSARIENDSLFVTVSSLFDKEKSWIKKSYVSNKAILDHAQAHFDLNEVYARKFRELLTSKPVLREKAYEDIQARYETIKKEALSAHTEFDKESSHASNLIGQRNWKRLIYSDLRSLEKHSKKEVAVPLN